MNKESGENYTDVRRLLMENMRELWEYYGENKNKSASPAVLNEELQSLWKKHFPASPFRLIEKDDIALVFDSEKEAKKWERENKEKWERLERVGSTSVHLQNGNKSIPVFISINEYMDGEKELSFSYIHPADLADKIIFWSFRKDLLRGWQTEPWDAYRSYHIDYLCKVFERLFSLAN